MRQAIATILSTTLVAWGLAATPVFAESRIEAGGPGESVDSRIERCAQDTTSDADQAQQNEACGKTERGAAAQAQPATVPMTDHLLALLHRLNRVDGSPMAPFRLN